MNAMWAWMSCGAQLVSWYGPPRGTFISNMYFTVVLSLLGRPTPGLLQ